MPCTRHRACTLAVAFKIIQPKMFIVTFHRCFFIFLPQLSTPLIISFELPIMMPGREPPDNDTQYVIDVENKFNIQVGVRMPLRLYIYLLSGWSQVAGLILLSAERRELSLLLYWYNSMLMMTFLVRPLLSW